MVVASQTVWLVGCVEMVMLADTCRVAALEVALPHVPVTTQRYWLLFCAVVTEGML